MTDFVQNAGSAFIEWAHRHIGPFIAIVFAVGFAWAQFDGVAAALTETREELRDLRREFTAFRLSGEAIDRAEMQALLARQREVDLRQDAALSAALVALRAADEARVRAVGGAEAMR